MAINKNVLPTDSITITTTYGELAKAYAVIGRMNGEDFGENLFSTISKLMDEGDKVLDSNIRPDSWKDLGNYYSYQKQWLEAIFPAYKQKTEAQLKLEELQKTIEDAQRQIEQLKEEI
jgi:hypothetical protein